MRCASNFFCKLASLCYRCIWSLRIFFFAYKLIITLKQIIMSKATLRAVQKTGTYQNDQNETKNNYIDLGVVIENDKGHLSLKLNALPLPNDKGEVWVNLFPIDSKKAK